MKWSGGGANQNARDTAPRLTIWSRYLRNTDKNPVTFPQQNEVGAVAKEITPHKMFPYKEGQPLDAPQCDMTFSQLPLLPAAPASAAAVVAIFSNMGLDNTKKRGAQLLLGAQLHPLLHGAGGTEAVHVHGARLPDAVHPRHGLQVPLQGDGMLQCQH